jgi:hypothetical protein
VSLDPCLVQTMPQIVPTGADRRVMVLVITLVLVSWIVLPLPFAVAVGRAFQAGHRSPAPPPREPAAPNDLPSPQAGDLAA